MFTEGVLCSYIYCFYLFLGPIASVLVAIFGCRRVAIFGAIMSSVAFFLCTWSPNVQVMILLYGLLGGEFWATIYCMRGSRVGTRGPDPPP